MEIAAIDLGACARYYAKELGWSVFPLAEGSKVPLAGSNGKDDATTDQAQIRAWWEDNPKYNIGVATGAVSGIVVMDIDPRNGGAETLFEKILEHGELPDTTTFKTGGGGLHYIFKHPGWKVSSKGVFEGIDSKGDGGYIIAPPSLHSSGDRYKVVQIIKPADMPEWWAEKVKAKEAVKGVKKVVSTGFPEGKYLDGEQFKQGERDTALFAIACSMRNYDLDEDEIYARLSEVNIKRCVPAMEDKDIKRISKSASKYPAGVTHADFGGDEVDSPARGLTLPLGYKIRPDGIFHTNARDEVKKIFPIPVALTRRLKNVDTGIEKIEMQFYRDKKWIPVITARSVLFNASKVIELSDQSLPVSSSNAKEFVRYLTEFEACNLDLQLDESISRLGWVGNDRFYPGVSEGLQLDAPDSIVGGYVCSGMVSVWAKNVQPILDHDISRLILASSFASPLLKILKIRSFVVYAYGPTRGGKTTSIKVALSVWGNPETTMVQFNDTTNSIEQRAALNAHVPIGLDERQADANQSKAEQLIYLLANGQSKGRLNKDSTAQPKLRWQNITLATGEDALTTDSTRGGVISRGIELYGRPLPDEKLSSSLHGKLEETYGTAGPEFMRYILAKKGMDELKEELSNIKTFLAESCEGNIPSHISSVAAIILADLYMHQLFFKDRDVDSLDLGTRILGMLQDKQDIDDARRAYDEFISWSASNANSFDALSREVSGWIDDGYIYVYPTVFKRVIKDLGFNDRSVKQSWAIRGWLKTEKRGGKLRLSCRATPPSGGGQQTMISIKRETQVS